MSESDSGPGPDPQDDVRVAFGQWLTEMLHWRRLKKADVARRMGVEGTLISRWTLGKGRPDPTSAQLLAAALDVPLDEVLRVAGHLPSTYRPAEDPVKERLYAAIEQLPSSALEPYVAVFEAMLATPASEK